MHLIEPYHFFSEEHVLNLIAMKLDNVAHRTTTKAGCITIHLGTPPTDNDIVWDQNYNVMQAFPQEKISHYTTALLYMYFVDNLNRNLQYIILLSFAVSVDHVVTSRKT